MIKYIPTKEINFALNSVNREKIIKVNDASNILKKYKQTNNEDDDYSVKYKFKSSIKNYKNKLISSNIFNFL
jgi:hypothetical protein